MGVVDMEYHQRLGDHRPQARVNDLVVTERARRAGVGTELLGRAEALARKRGCFRMALVTAGWREATIAFYAREGWADYGTVVREAARSRASGRAASPRRQLVQSD